MITVDMAYRKLLTKIPNAKVNSCFDWGNFFTFPNDGEEDVYEWKIDKSSGKLTEMDYYEHMNELRKHPNDDDVIEIDISKI